MKRILKNPVTWLLAVYAVAWGAMLYVTHAMDLLSFQPGVESLGSDAGQYDALARSLITNGTFSLDGITPFFEREPGYSVFLALIYAVFGVGSYDVVFFVQAVLHAVAAVVFVRAVRPMVPRGAPTLLLALLLLSPPVFHVLFAVTRESVSLSLTMFLTAGLFWLLKSPSYKHAAIVGAVLGMLILTMSTFVLFPFFVIALLLLWRVSWKKIVLLCMVCAAVLAPWGIRNLAHRDMLCLTGCYRAALQWHVRGEQAEQIPVGTEPFMCLWAEYVSRDWSQRSLSCSFNAVWHRKWPAGFVGVPEDAVIAREGQQRILRNSPSYLWFSMFEVLELHLPYVNGWGRLYNASAILWTVLAYLGALVSLPFLRRKEWLLVGALIGYITGIYALTDATPRYLVPILHCYALLAAIGYTATIRALWQKSASSSRP